MERTPVHFSPLVHLFCSKLPTGLLCPAYYVQAGERSKLFFGCVFLVDLLSRPQWRSWCITNQRWAAWHVALVHCAQPCAYWAARKRNR